MEILQAHGKPKLHFSQVSIINVAKNFHIPASEFKNLCSLAEICLCIGASNSTVERRFSLLSNILTDKHLRISHKAMENCLLVAANSVNFTSAERD